MTRLGEGLLELDDPPVKALFVYASNPAASVPHQTKVLRGLARDDLFTVVVEHFLTDTARYADIVLPATMQIEHRDLLIAYGHLYLAWNEPAVPPPGECLPTTEIFRRLARTMGLDEPALYDSDEAMARQVLDSGHPSLAGITLEALKARGSMRLELSRSVRAVRDRLSDAVGQAGVRLRSDGAGGTGSGRRLHAARTRPSQRDTTLAREYPLALVTPAESLLPELDLRQRAAAAAAVGRRRRS